MNIRASDKIFSNSTYHLAKDENGTYHLDFKGKIIMTLVKLKLSVVIKIAENDKFDCEGVLLERTVDLCKMNERTMNGPVFSLVYKSIHEKVNFPLSCPYQKGIYELKNASFPMPKTWFKVFAGFFCYKISFSAKTTKARKFDDILNYDGVGSFEL